MGLILSSLARCRWQWIGVTAPGMAFVLRGELGKDRGVGRRVLVLLEALGVGLMLVCCAS